MTQHPNEYKRIGLVRHMLNGFLFDPVYPGLVFTFEWRHDAIRDQWVLHRRNARGAMGSIVYMCGLGGTVIGGILLGWLKTNEPVSLGFLGAVLALFPFALYRLGSATRVTVGGDGATTYSVLLFGWRIRGSASSPVGVSVYRGIIQFFSPLAPERDGVWIDIDRNGDPQSIVLACGTAEAVQSYVERMPPPFASRCTGSQIVCVARMMRGL